MIKLITLESETRSLGNMGIVTVFFEKDSQKALKKENFTDEEVDRLIDGGYVYREYAFGMDIRYFLGSVRLFEDDKKCDF